MTSLNPAFTLGDQLSEAVMRHQDVSRAEAMKIALQILEKVQIPAAEMRLKAYPHQLSGGMRQRVMIAMALINHPKLLIADEPTTALDVTIRAQILALLNTLKEETGTAVLMITHDLGVVAEVAQQVAVMYAGQVVEQGSVEAIFADPQHPYTIGLMGSIPPLAHARARFPLFPDRSRCRNPCRKAAVSQRAARLRSRAAMMKTAAHHARRGPSGRLLPRAARTPHCHGRNRMTTPILEARDLSKLFPGRKTLFPGPVCHGGRSRFACRDAGRNAGDCRRVRLREIHPWPSAAASAGRQRRTRVLSGEKLPTPQAPV